MTSEPVMSLYSLVLLVVCAAEPGKGNSNPVLNMTKGSVTVSGVGQVEGKPSQLEVRFRVAGHAELSSDAVVKFQDARRRAIEAIEKLKLSRLTWDLRGLTVANPAQEQQNENTAIKPRLEFASVGTLTVAGIENLTENQALDLMAKVIDALRDAGVSLIPATADAQIDSEQSREDESLAAFVIENPQPLIQAATKKAFEAAQAEAENLSSLAGAKLGPAIDVDSDFPDPDMLSTDPKDSSKAKPIFRSHRFSPVPIRVRLKIKFAMVQSISKD